MWPFDSPMDMLRVGRVALEYWTIRNGVKVRAAASPLPDGGRPNAADLADALKQLLARVSAESSEQRSPRTIDVVVESAWMPVIGLELDGRFWSASKLDTLLAHQLNQLYGPPTQGHWQLRHDYRAGDPFALGFGLASDILHALEAELAASDFRCGSLEPALAWSWHAGSRQRASGRRPWWVCIEQDRSIVCHVDGKHVDAIHAGAAPAANLDDIARLVQFEGLRFGVPAVSGVLAYAWTAPLNGPTNRPASAGDIQWMSWGAAPEAPAARSVTLLAKARSA